MEARKKMQNQGCIISYLYNPPQLSKMKHRQIFWHIMIFGVRCPSPLATNAKLITTEIVVVREFVIPADAGIHAFIFNRYGCPLSRA